MKKPLKGGDRLPTEAVRTDFELRFCLMKGAESAAVLSAMERRRRGIFIAWGVSPR